MCCIVLHVLHSVACDVVLHALHCVVCVAACCLHTNCRTFPMARATRVCSCVSCDTQLCFVWHVTHWQLKAAWSWRLGSVTRHTSHVTRHTSHVTRHTSHVTRHTSHVTRHTSHITRHHTSHITTHHTSHVTRLHVRSITKFRTLAQHTSTLKGGGSKQQAASSKQQAASSKQQAASSKQQAASSKQQAASSSSTQFLYFSCIPSSPHPILPPPPSTRSTGQNKTVTPLA